MFYTGSQVLIGKLSKQYLLHTVWVRPSPWREQHKTRFCTQTRQLSLWLSNHSDMALLGCSQHELTKTILLMCLNVHISRTFIYEQKHTFRRKAASLCLMKIIPIIIHSSLSWIAAGFDSWSMSIFMFIFCVSKHNYLLLFCITQRFCWLPPITFDLFSPCLYRSRYCRLFTVNQLHNFLMI